jgi:hypothetical protein
MKESSTTITMSQLGCITLMKSLRTETNTSHELSPRRSGTLASLQMDGRNYSESDKMMPTPAIENTSNATLAYAKFGSKLFSRETIFAPSPIILSNISNLVRSEFYPMMCTSLNFEGFILFLGTIAKILKAVVRSIPIEMTCLLTLWARADKCQKDQTMDYIIESLSISTYLKSLVSMVRICRSQNSTLIAKIATIRSKRTDLAQVRCLIAKKTWYRLPNLLHRNLLAKKSPLGRLFVAQANTPFAEGADNTKYERICLSKTIIAELPR